MTPWPSYSVYELDGCQYLYLNIRLTIPDLHYAYIYIGLHCGVLILYFRRGCTLKKFTLSVYLSLVALHMLGVLRTITIISF